MPEGVKKAVTEALSKAVHYPDPLCRKLCQALSTEYQLPAEYFICGNGGADLIYRLVYALRPKKALLTIPTFAEYEEALKQTNTECIFHKSWEDYKVPYDILERMNSSIDVMFLCNPNNPTGLLISPNLLVRILAKAEKLGIYFADAGAWNIELTFDGVHFSEEGHRAFARGIRTALEQIMSELNQER